MQNKTKILVLKEIVNTKLFTKMNVHVFVSLALKRPKQQLSLHFPYQFFGKTYLLKFKLWFILYFTYNEANFLILTFVILEKKF